MPLNQPKTYEYIPTPVGGVKLITRSSRRSRLWAGGTYFRSKERGEQANLIKISVVEDTADEENPEGLFVVHHTVLLANESISTQNMSTPLLKLFELNLKWDEELRITYFDGTLGARIYGIRWQIAGGEELRFDLGPISDQKLVAKYGVSFKISTVNWPVDGVLYLRPRVHRYHLERTSVTDPNTMTSSTGWSIDDLRATINGSDNWIRMPNRPKGSASAGGGSGGPLAGGEDPLDDGTDEDFLSAFDSTPMTGGDGLPSAPVGWNTGPDRTLVHLNYSETDSGSMGVLNEVYEWVGDTSTNGSWQRYS